MGRKQQQVIDYLHPRSGSAEHERGPDRKCRDPIFDAIIVDTFKRISFLLPTVSIREAFEGSITSIFNQIENLTLQNQKLCAARDLLLPKLMNGKITV